MDQRPTPQQEARLDRVLDALVWAVWAFLCWHLIGFILEAFSPLFPH